MFQILIDTGGTFTDCIATDPLGNIIRTKVLSSSFLRGKIIEKIAPKYFQIEVNWSFDKRLIVGFSFRIIGQTEFCKIVDVQGDTVIVDTDFEIDLNTDFELTSHEEAPILATRIVTNTPLNQSFPKLTIRLGTTKGTNALLERKGAKVALLVTKGFKDLLRIGTQQRPNLFQINIPEPTILYDSVIEVNERLDSKGNQLIELSKTELQRIENELDKSKCESVAVSFLHSYLNIENESKIKNQKSSISLSSSLSTSIGYLKRTQTALVNAYLQPILSEYLRNITTSLGGQTLQIMNSAGGLVKAENFNAKDSLLSGPAGGLVGAAAIAQRLGFERCITFDMGGTSTDTARFDGHFDLQFVTKIDGIELHNPTLAIETVAAGGGSICSFDGQKLKVGPESAGANPGPACYGAGGPLTITDVNLLLEKLDISQFGIPIRIEKAEEELVKILTEIKAKTGEVMSEFELLRGFEQIANEKMAEAIRRISVAKGFDPKDYPLLAFGGAGGLHGCQLAEILGIDTVILPYDAGLLSAFGMGEAKIERIESKQVLKNLNQVDIETIFDELIEKANDYLETENIIHTEIKQKLLYLRFKGQENAIEVAASPPAPPAPRGGAFFSPSHVGKDGTPHGLGVGVAPPLGAGGAVRGQFLSKYKSLFGYCPDNLEIEVESAKVIVSELSSGKRVMSIERINNYSKFSYSTTINWDDLQPFDTFEGPNVLINATSTSYIPVGWRAEVSKTKDVILRLTPSPLTPEGGITSAHNQCGVPSFPTRKGGRKAPLSGAGGAIQLELFTNRFMAIAEEMGVQLQRTAFSVNVKERLDFSCALLDAEAELLVNAPHIPVHLGSLGICARLVMEKINIQKGDVIITNHPKYGGSHLPDVTLISGIFTTDNQLIGYGINRAHHAEIGGKSPGSMPPDATNLSEEGVVILPTYLVKNGEMQWEVINELFTKSKYPTRALTENIADINAALASLKTGEIALQKLVETHGLTKVHQYMKLLKDSSAEALRLALKPFENQVLEAVEKMDDGREIKVKIVAPPAPRGGAFFSPSLVGKGLGVGVAPPLGRYAARAGGASGLGAVLFDFTGTSSRHPNNLNANISIIYSAILYVLRLLVNKNIPLNEGLMSGIEVSLPEDSFLHPHFSDNPDECPAVVGGNTEVSQRLVDTLLKAFGLSACSQGTMNNFLFGNEHFGYYETICGGTGASQGHHGRSAVHQHMTNTRITDPEELERRYPVCVEQFSIRKNSGGRGKWNGGDGIIREIKFLENLNLTLISQHRNVAPYGMRGGEAGQIGKQTLIRVDGSIEEKEGIFSTNVSEGDRIVLGTPGGGGWGDKL